MFPCRPLRPTRAPLILVAALSGADCADSPPSTDTTDAGSCDSHFTALADWRALYADELDASLALIDAEEAVGEIDARVNANSASDSLMERTDRVMEWSTARFQAIGLATLEREARSKVVAAWDPRSCQACREWDVARAAWNVLHSIDTTEGGVSLDAWARGWSQRVVAQGTGYDAYGRELFRAAEVCWPQEETDK